MNLVASVYMCSFRRWSVARIFDIDLSTLELVSATLHPKEYRFMCP